MLVAYFLMSLFYLNCKSEKLFFTEEHIPNQTLITCVIDIVEKYFSKKNSLTYVDMLTGDEVILKAIHSLTVTSLVYRQSINQSHFRHQAYFITANNATKFTERFKYLLQEPTWNPYARFVIVIKSLKVDELTKIFDELLKRLVINVLVINSEDTQIYSYNPYDNYGCGKYYSKVISYGTCIQSKSDLFPNKLVTGLRTCNIDALIGDLPPYSFHRPETSVKTLGTEQYLFKILAETEQFNVNFTFNYDKGLFSTITENMQVSGPMEKLLNNKTDVMFGGTVLVSSRADIFTYLHGYLDYDDELRFFVKRACYAHNWKNVYLEFQPFVWGLLFTVFLLYSTIMILLFRAKDKTEMILILFSTLLLHGKKLPQRTSGKFFFIIWLWFAYIINSTYQSNLVSLTTNPVKEKQISTEQELYRHNLKPCISPALLRYIYSETNISSESKTECSNNIQNVKLVAQSKDLFTIVPQSLFKYHKKTYNDEYGQSPVYSFKKPYAQIIFAYFFQKGFPLSDRMRRNVIRLRENGLVAKSLKDHYYARKIKYHFHKKGFETRLVVPWWIYTIGCCAATIVFIFELLLANGLLL